MARIGNSFLGGLTLAIAACASSPPPSGLLDEATLAIQRAESSGAVEHAPIELRLARERLAGARLAIEERDNARAARLAEQAQVNSELAEAKTAAARAREAARAQEQDNRELQDDLGTGGGDG